MPRRNIFEGGVEVEPVSSPPSGRSVGDVYLDDGTNTGDSNPGWRRLVSTGPDVWTDVYSDSDSSPFQSEGGDIKPITAAIGDNLIVGSQNMNDSGAPNDSRMFFDKGNGAFRAGYVDGTQWDSGSRGASSVAFGNNTTASGNFSDAKGVGCEATGSYSSAKGNTTKAQGAASVSWGTDSLARNDYSEANAGGSFLSQGDGQNLRINCGTSAVSVTPKELSVGYDKVGSDIDIPDGAIWGFTARVLGVSAPGDGGDSYFAFFVGTVERTGSNVSVVPGPSPLAPEFEVKSAGAAVWSAAVKDDTGGQFVIEIVGGDSVNTQWVAEVQVTEISMPDP